MPATAPGLRFDLERSGSLNDVLRRLTDLGRSRKVIENSIMRDMATSAAERMVPMVRAGVMRSPVPQARAVAATVRSRRDRMIVVRVGATNPKMSGWKRNSRNKYWRGSIAWGVAVGPGPSVGPVQAHSVKGHRVDGYSTRRGRVRSYRRGAYSRGGYTRPPLNVYRVSRAGSADDPFSGYLSGLRDDMEARAIEEYAAIIVEVCRRNGWPISDSPTTRTGVAAY